MKKKQVPNIGIALIVSFCFLTICSRSSFIYPFNNWDDSNSYFTMGKALMNGGILYRDVFDQKGPLLYFIYGLGYLLSNSGFGGIFFLEILSFTLFLVAEYQVARLYLSQGLAMCTMPLMALVVLTSKSFYWGGCAEEFCLPLFAWGLYFSVKYFKETYPLPMSSKLIFLNGFFAGCILLIKFNLLGLYFAFMAIIALSNLNRINWKKALIHCGIFLSGMVAPIIPWLIYFGLHSALDDWYFAYIYCNVFLYSNLYFENRISIGEKIYDLAKIMYWLILDNAIFFIPIILGFVCILFNKKFKWFEKINLYTLFGFLFLGIYVGGTTLYYYSLPLSVFSIFGFIIVGMGIETIIRRFDFQNLSQKYFVPGAFILYIGMLILAWNLSMNTPYAAQSKEDFWLFKFRDIISQTENATLLNIGCLDAGLYTAADIMPTCRYFQSNAVHGFEEVANEQRRYIAEGQTEFVLARESYPEEIWLNYHLVSEQDYMINEQLFTYYLFQRN